MTKSARTGIAACLCLALLPASCGDVRESESQPAEERSAAGDVRLGSASVELSGQVFEFVVIGCMEAEEDPSELLEFGGSGVHPDVPRAEIEAALRADAEDDGADEAASVARNVEASRRFLEFGPTFGWQRFIEYGDVVALTLDERVVEGEGAWFSVEAMEGGTFIEREGRTFRGTTPVENTATGGTGTLRFEASCP